MLENCIAFRDRLRNISWRNFPSCFQAHMTCASQPGRFPSLTRFSALTGFSVRSQFRIPAPILLAAEGTASVIYCFCCTMQAGIRAVRSHMNTGIIKERDEYGRCQYCGQRKVVRSGVGFAILDRLCFGCVR